MASPFAAYATYLKLAPGLAAVIVLAAVGSCQALGRAAPPPTPGRPRTLVVVGDSITASAAEELTVASRRAGWSSDVDATPGAMTPDMQGAAERLAATAPRAAVVHLGTNDSLCAHQNRVDPEPCRLSSYTDADRDEELATMAGRLRDAGACVIGVVPYVDAGVTDALHRLERDGTIQAVADWSAQAVAHHDRYLVDEIGHLSDAGQQAYARFVLDAVERTCGSATLS